MIPRINFSSFYNDHESKIQTSRRIFSAFKEIGFLVLSDHGVSDTLFEEMFSLSNKIHILDNKTKAKYPFSSEIGTGFGKIGAEKLNKKYSDVKETFDVQGLFAVDKALVQETTKQFWRELERIYHDLLRCIALNLNLDENYLVNLCNKSEQKLRLLKYPVTKNAVRKSVIKEDNEEFVVRAGEHTDYGAISMVIQRSEGLQVKNKKGVWIDVPYEKNTIVVNVADLLMRWSNDLLVSTPHRVVSRVGEEEITRYSIAFFCSPNKDTLIKTLPNTFSAENPEKYRPVNTWQYVLGRINDSLKESESQQSKL
eukprot:maker-scaffold_18-snap-gene-1.6-mRNA-1 protein AED:0.01 eAED:0.01 QI:108/0.5/0.66/1/1/1/3/41/310